MLPSRHASRARPGLGASGRWRLPCAGLAFALLAAGACSAAKQGSATGGSGGGGATAASTTSSTSQGGTTSTGGTTGDTTTSSTGGVGGVVTTGGVGGVVTTGGVGGVVTTGGVGGAGGQTTTGTTTTAPTARVVLVAGGPASMIGAAFEEASGWSVTSLNSNTGSSPAVALTGPMDGVALFRASSDSPLLYTMWDGAGFTSPLGIGLLASAQSAASMSYGDSACHAGYWGVDSKHYYARYAGQGGGWSPVAEAVQPSGGVQSFGASPPSVAALGADLYLVHAGSDGKVYEQRRSGGTWNAATGHDVGGAQGTVTPTVAALSGNTEDLMIVYVLSANSQIGWLTRKPGNPPTWSAGAAVADALSQDRVAVAPLAGGGAVMAFRGLNTNIYTSIYTPGANPPWSPVAELANPNFSTPSTPALAPGIGAATAELAFADAGTGKILHSRRVGAAWQSPVQVGGAGMTHVGMASVP